MTTESIWLALGLTGQLFFTIRFVVQWLSSERAGRSVMPCSFWYFSIGGAVMLAAYAIHRRDPVFIIGQMPGLLIYARNLQLVRRTQYRGLPGPSVSGQTAGTATGCAG